MVLVLVFNFPQLVILENLSILDWPCQELIIRASYVVFTLVVLE